MSMKLIAIAATTLGLLASGAYAQQGTVNGAAGGAVTGAIVGTVLDPPPQKVMTYVQEQPMPDEPVMVQEKVVVGQPLPQTVRVVEVPDNPKYGYAIVNHERVIVEPSSRKVIRVVE